MALRIGTGYDVHALEAGYRLVLGGVNIPHTAGLVGHSDADVLVHAICDALLGAAALGDIGKHFPPTDDAYRGISSMILLAHVGELISAAGFKVANIDSTIAAQRPRLAEYIWQMRSNIAETLGLDVNQVSVKATTTEKLGFEGQELGISAQAAALLETR